ncbi:unnamed protein product [Rhodiola kirilowii]
MTLDIQMGQRNKLLNNQKKLKRKWRENEKKWWVFLKDRPRNYIRLEMDQNDN